MAASKIRYAPEDPTLPKPWRGLIDGNTGYLYFWNPTTNVTQYHRPQSDPLPPPASPPSQSPRRAAAPASQVAEEKEDVEQEDRRQREEELTKSQCHIAVEDSPDPQPHLHREQFQDDSVKGGPISHGMHDSRNGMLTSREQARPQIPSSSNLGNHTSTEAYRCQHEITVTGDVPPPFTTFDSTGFPPEILREVLRAGFSAPTPIQAQSWPIALQNRDIVAVAKTGSGKTLGYLIPGFIHLRRVQSDSKMGPRVLVLSPTRELATQIHDEAEKFGSSSRISSVCLYGGAPKGPQLRDLARGVDVVIATPGRLNDILEMGRVNLHQVSYMVLDEADRMLDMGFEPQIRKIVNAIPPRRQTLMFTATWPKEVRKIAADLLVNPVQVNIGNVDELVANKSITQYVEVITPMEKRRRLEQILQNQGPNSKIIVFCATKRMCDQLARMLTQFGATAIHGDKSQSERDSILAQFRSGASPVLVATDVAARGLDIKDIRAVVNYDFPTGIEDYVHRIGRTGRAGATGTAYTFFCDQDSKYASDLVKILEGASQRVPEELRDMVSRGGYGGKSRRFAGYSARDECGGGGARYGADESSGPRYSSRQDTTIGYGHGGYGGGYKPSCARPEDDGAVWSHEKLMAAGGFGGSSTRGNNNRQQSSSGGMWGGSSRSRSRSRSRSPIGGY